MQEIWSDIQNYEDNYQVSNTGSIRSKQRQVRCKGNKMRTVKGKVRKIFPNYRGYMTIVLSKNNTLKTFTVHQLVAQAFLADFKKGNELNHIDGNPQNNHIDNLEKSNPSHNQLHAIQTGLRDKNGRSQYHNVSFDNTSRSLKRWIAEISHQGKSIGRKRFLTEIEAAHHVNDILDSMNDTQRFRNFP